MINEKVRNIIDSFSNISQSMIFSYPLTAFKNKSGDILVFMDMTKLDVMDFPEFGILNFGEYSNIVKILGNDSTIELDNHIITIMGQDKTAVRYLTTDLRTLEDYKFKAKNHPSVEVALEAFNTYEVAMKFQLTDKNMTKLKSISSVLKFTDFNIKASGDCVNIQVKNTQKSTNDFNITLDAEVNKDIEMLLNVENFTKIPNNTYIVTVYKLPGNDIFILKLTSDNLPGVSIFMTPKASQ